MAMLLETDTNVAIFTSVIHILLLIAMDNVYNFQLIKTPDIQTEFKVLTGWVIISQPWLTYISLSSRSTNLLYSEKQLTVFTWVYCLICLSYNCVSKAGHTSLSSSSTSTTFILSSICFRSRSALHPIGSWVFVLELVSSSYLLRSCHVYIVNY